MAELSDIKGLGDARIKKLRKAGIASVEALAGADTETLSEKCDISVGTLQKLVDRAKTHITDRYGDEDGRVLASDVLEVVTDIHQRVAALELRVKALEVRLSDPVPEHIVRLSSYIGEHLNDWQDRHIFSYLREHGHPDHHIAHAVDHWRRSS